MTTQTNNSTSRAVIWLLLKIMLSAVPGLAFSAEPPSSAGTAKAQAQTIIVLGDSLSAGYGLSPRQSWVYQMQQKFLADYPGFTVVNASISGATTAQGLSQLPTLLEKHPNAYLILELGANDGLQGKPIPYIKKNLKNMIEKAQSQEVAILLVGIKLPPNLGKRYTEPFYQMYVQLAKEHDIPLVPFLLEGVAGQKGLMQTDGLHPNAEASELILNNVWPYVSKLIDPKEASTLSAK